MATWVRLYDNGAAWVDFRVKILHPPIAAMRHALMATLYCHASHLNMTTTDVHTSNDRSIIFDPPMLTCSDFVMYDFVILHTYIDSSRPRSMTFHSYDTSWLLGRPAQATYRLLSPPYQPSALGLSSFNHVAFFVFSSLLTSSFV